MVAAFGAKCSEKLSGPGDREAAIRAPLETLVAGVGKLIGVPAYCTTRCGIPNGRCGPTMG